MPGQILAERLAEIPGIGRIRANELITAGVKKIADLRAEKYAHLLSEETKLYLKYKPIKEMSWDFANSLISHLPKYLIGVGSYRRKKPILRDIDLLTTKPLAEVAADIEKAAKKKGSSIKLAGEYAAGEKRRSFILQFQGRYVRVDIFGTTREELPFALLHHTGSRLFNIRTRAQAKRRGYKLTQYGLFKGTQKILAKNERDILKIIGVTYKPPQARNE